MGQVGQELARIRGQVGGCLGVGVEPSKGEMEGTAGGHAGSGQEAWLDGDGAVLLPDGAAVPLEDQEALKAAVHEAFRRGEWARVASRRADFQGAERGVDEAISRAAGRRLHIKA